VFARLKGLREASRENKRLRRALDEANSRISQQERRIMRLLEESGEASRRIRAENIVWIFGSGRTGSTWLSRMMSELTKTHTFWNEPWVGYLFDPYHLRMEAKSTRRQRKAFILAPQYRSTWLRSIRAFVLDGAAARFPEMGPDDRLVIKEPGGSVGAPLLMEALPESRMILLVRDPRDVVASQADAHGERGWMSDRQEPDSFSVERARKAANVYRRNVEKAKQAYKSHEGRKVLVKYEELRADTLETMKRICSALEITVEEGELARAVEKHSWENIPEEEKGSGKKFRKATPGGWREDLTPEQIKTVERITAPLLEEFYPGSALRS
jgi:Sulfotransferase family